MLPVPLNRIGWLVTVVAALLPARRASRVPPVACQRRRSCRRRMLADVREDASSRRLQIVDLCNLATPCRTRFRVEIFGTLAPAS